MFIIKFNNMVKNKWIWAAFAIVVAVAFGASDMLGAGSRAREGGGRLGSLGGKALDPGLYQTVGNLIRYRNLMGGTQDTYSARERWKLCAALLRARESGLSVSDSELAAIIRGMGFFRDADGQFSSETYNRVLSRIEFTPTTLNGMNQPILTPVVPTTPKPSKPKPTKPSPTPVGLR